MNNTETDNKPNQEDIIFDEIISSEAVNIEIISNKDLEALIKEKIEKANYLSEWQVGYAVERIFKKIKKQQRNGVELKKGLSITSLVLGIISTAPVFSTAGIVAVILGHISLNKIKKYPNVYAGKSYAIWGLVFGYLGIIIGIFLGIIMKAIVKSKLG